MLILRERTMTMMRATITLPEDLLHDVDMLAGKGGRSSFVAEAVAAKVKREKLRKALDETRGALKHSEWWSTPEETYRWVRAQREDRDTW
jgi:metal-responsive CopG/Arc/MetJ family transcriptional regulator